jgi:hypothetical protein
MLLECALATQIPPSRALAICLHAAVRAAPSAPVGYRDAGHLAIRFFSVCVRFGPCQRCPPRFLEKKPPKKKTKQPKKGKGMVVAFLN